VQDHRGIIYFGNNYGILSFDGHNWHLSGIPNKTIIRSLAIDKEGRIYVGGQNDFGYLRPDSRGQLQYVSLKSKIAPPFRDFADVWKIYVTSEGVIFCTSTGHYLLKNNQIDFFQIDAGGNGFPFYVRERFFVPIPGKGIFERKGRKAEWIPNSDQLKDVNISAMLPYEEGQILIVTQEHGLFIFDGDRNFKPCKTAADTFLKKSRINSAIALRDGYALGSTHNGLLIIDKQGNPRQHLNREKGLQNSAVQTIYQDYSGNLWLGLNNGIDYVEINSPFTLFNARNGLPGTAYASYLDEERMYLGTNDGLYYQNRKEPSPLFQSSRLHLVEGTQGQVNNLQLIQNLLLLSHHTGPYQVIGDRAYRLSDHQGIWLFKPLLSQPDYVLCGTYSGLLLYRISHGKLVFQRKIEGFSESSRVMEEDAEGNIWIAHGYKGIYQLRLSAGLDKVERVRFYNERHGFPSNLFINVFKLNNGLVFAGERGIYRYDKQRDLFVDDTDFGRLLDKNQHIRKLIEDKEGNIWFSAGTQMGVLKKRENGSYTSETKAFNKLEGRLVGGFEHIAYYDKNNLLIGTDEGFVHYNPSFVQSNSLERPFYTLIRKVEMPTQRGDSLLSGGTFSDQGQISVHQPDSLTPTLPYSNHSLKFTYSALSYEDIEKIQYQYRLEGFETNWSPWVSFTQKEYTNLKEGDYVFQVKARDIYGRESSESSFRFRVKPPWYRSVWAYAGYGFFGILALMGLRKGVERKVNQTRERLKQEQEKALRLKEAQHTEEVLQAEKEIIRLNNEKLENELKHKNKELASSAIHVMHSQETVQKIREQLQDVIDQVRDKEAQNQLRKMLKSVDEEIRFENTWEQFEFHFNQIHQDFLNRLRADYPQLTPGDIKMCAYLRLNLSSKEIAPLLNLSLRGIEASRYRIRKKMNLDQEVNLTDFLLRY